MLSTFIGSCTGSEYIIKKPKKILVNHLFVFYRISTIGYMWGTVGLLYRKDRIKDADAKSWSLVFDPQKDPGPFALLDSVREMMGITLMYKGYDFNSIEPAELKAVADLLIKTKKRKNCQGFKAGVGAKNEVVSGAASVAITYNGDGVRATAEDPDNLGFVVPNEGSEIWLDLMCIPAKAPNPEAAHKWIDFILEPKRNAEISMWNQLATANGTALQYIKKEYLDNPAVWPPPEVIKKLAFVKDLGKDNRIVDEAWTAIKSQ